MLQIKAGCIWIEGQPANNKQNGMDLDACDVLVGGKHTVSQLAVSTT